MIDLSIRKATLEDAEAIAIINVKTWQCAYRGKMPNEILDSMDVQHKKEGWEEWIKADYPKTYIFVAEVNDMIVGYCYCGGSKGTEDLGEIYSLYVDPEFQGQGVGSALMENAFQFMKKQQFKSAILWVLTSNEPTIKFYEHKGWKNTGETKIDTRWNMELHETKYRIDL